MFDGGNFLKRVVIYSSEHKAFGKSKDTVSKGCDMKDKGDFFTKKLNEDDLLEILLEHFQEIEFKTSSFSRAILLGTPGKDLRFISIFGDEDDIELRKCNLEEIDRRCDFNGDHSFLEKNPKFIL